MLRRDSYQLTNCFVSAPGRPVGNISILQKTKLCLARSLSLWIPVELIRLATTRLLIHRLFFLLVSHSCTFRSAKMPKAPKAAAPVPESVLKKRKAQEALAVARAAKMVEDKKASKIERKSILNKAKAYAKEYENAAKDVVTKRREAKKHGNFYMEPEPKLMLVVRIKGINAIDPKTRKILQLMRLRQVCRDAKLRSWSGLSGLAPASSYSAIFLPTE